MALWCTQEINSYGAVEERDTLLGTGSVANCLVISVSATHFHPSLWVRQTCC